MVAGGVPVGHFKSNLRDIEFNLFEVLKRQDLLGAEPFAEVDEVTARGILDEVARLAEGPIAESFADADRTLRSSTRPLTRSRCRSRSRSPIRRSLTPSGSGWSCPPSSAAPPSRGRSPGRSPSWSSARIPAIWMYSSLGSFSHALWLMGTPAQKKMAERAIEGRWGYTMVLTEPDAGSDVGAGRTRAVQQPDGSWHIEGVKRFITSAEHDLTENILHIVLARPEGAGPGTKGLSMFLVPKYHVNDDGSLGERNGVYVTNVEHKMGLKASTTCELTFGAEHPAVGTLIGDVHDGIRQMFMIIEFARMMVGTKAIAALSTGYLNALDYARDPGPGRRPDADDRQGRAARHDHEATLMSAAVCCCRRPTPRACARWSCTPPASRTRSSSPRPGASGMSRGRAQRPAAAGR